MNAKRFGKIETIFKAEFSAGGLFFAHTTSFYQRTQSSQLPIQVLAAWSTISALDRYLFTNEGILDPTTTFIAPVCGYTQPMTPLWGVSFVVDNCYLPFSKSDIALTG